MAKPVDTLEQFSWSRVFAMVSRYWYLMRGSWVRLFELVYWPVVQVLTWGFISEFLMQNSSWVAQASGILLAAVLLWDIMFRTQIGVSISFLEEMWSRNLGHLFVSPLRPYEWLIGLMVTSFIRVILGVTPAMILAYLFYGFDILTLGIPLLAFFLNLVLMGWWLSIFINSMVLHFGLAAENLAWMGMFLIAPVSAIYYPVSIFPAWLQTIAWCLPSTYVFEGLRTLMIDHIFRYDYFFTSLAINAVFFTASIMTFLWAFRLARHRGLLLKQGE